jgi:anti-anti-sigma factor
MLLKIHTDARGDTLRVTLSGELDASAVQAFRAAVEDSDLPWRRAELDLSDVAFMDSTGLGVLLGLHERAREEGREVVLARPSAPVMRLLELTGLEQRFALCD